MCGNYGEKKKTNHRWGSKLMRSINEKLFPLFWLNVTWLKALFLQPQQSLFQSICGMTRGGVSRKQQTRTLHICFTSFSSWRCTYTCSQFRTASPGPASVPFSESGYCMCVCRQRRAVVFLMSKDYHVFLPLRCPSLYTSIHLCMFPFQTHLLCSLFLIRTIFHSPPARPPSPQTFLSDICFNQF